MTPTKIIVSIIIAAVVVGGGVAAYKSSSKDASPEVVSNSTSTPSVETPASEKKMAFSQFVKQGGSYKCTVNQSVGGIDTKGTTYIDKGMIKGVYSTKTQGFSVDTNFIMRDGYSYSWSSMAPTMGYRIKVQDNPAMDTRGAAATSGSFAFNAEQIGDYECVAWTADAATFAIPSSVTFTQI